MKVLLLTEMPPCEGYSGGLVLAALVRLLPRGSVCCFAVVNPNLPVAMAKEFGGVPAEFRAKPNENWRWLPHTHPLGRASTLVSRAGEQLILKTVVQRRIAEAVAFGRAQRVDRVWAVLQGQTSIRMARAVARKLGVPLYTQVWDPFTWWAKANRLDLRTTRQVAAEFDAAMAGSVRIATASQPMAELYRERYGRPALPVIASHPAALAQTPDVAAGAGDALLIGMAGQVYAADEWRHLIRAMDDAGWRVDGRPVQIVVLGPLRPPEAPPDRVAFLGWRTQGEAARILSCCDVLYCPYPFAPEMDEVSRFSFPSKLVLYLAAGRPIVVHGPAHSSPARYVEDHGCGVVAPSIAAGAIHAAIDRLVRDPDLYAAAGAAAQAAFLDDFTLESMARAFRTFLDAPGGGDATPQDHGSRDGDLPWPERLSGWARAQAVSVWGLSAGRALKRAGSRGERLLRQLVRRPRRPARAACPVADRASTAIGNLSPAGRRLIAAVGADRVLLVGPSTAIAPLLAGGPAAGDGPARLTVCSTGCDAAAARIRHRIEVDLAVGPLEGPWEAARQALPREAMEAVVRLAIIAGADKIVVVAERETEIAVALAIAAADLLAIPVALVGVDPGAVSQAAWLVGRSGSLNLEGVAPRAGGADK